MTAPGPMAPHPPGVEEPASCDLFIANWIAPIELTEAEERGFYATPLTADQQLARDAEREHDAEHDQ